MADRALCKWIKAFNDRGVDGFIVKKRPGRTMILQGKQAQKLTELINPPEKAERTFFLDCQGIS